MNRRLTIGIALPVSVGLIAIAGVMHSPASHTFASAATPPPPPTFIPTTIPGPPGPPTATSTVTPTPLPTATTAPTVAPSATAAPSPTDTVVPPSPTNTPKPVKTKTPVPTATATTAPPAPTVAPQKTKPVPISSPVLQPTQSKTGGGGTYLYSSNNTGKLSHTSLSTLGATSNAATRSNLAGGGVTSLPRTGGGAGGNNPTSPLAPLALLAAIAIGAGRFLPRLLKR